MFSTFEKIKELSKKQGVSLQKVAEDLGFSVNYLYTLKEKTPKSDRLQEIADYFNVSTDYLLGRTDNPTIASNKNNDLITSQEQQALVMFRKETENMTDMEKERFNNALSGLMQTARSLIEDDSNWK
ncbi:helix-turn-helix domain-containing protein [Streptococcus gallolyticus]|uniref:helix-turn-helix domain-containing protein n=1 Tax=Streptococcus gallolyticus TaxID=315405 RepID=UPI002284402A|nr:helix-turn-helix transcriptional regulator [Streptococcus gallolyticus]MCY7156729.1 helix-turn-helix domain-containing protein [Streptococcus gallolyticus subsp. gallolyticus]